MASIGACRWKWRAQRAFPPAAAARERGGHTSAHLPTSLCALQLGTARSVLLLLTVSLIELIDFEALLVTDLIDVNGKAFSQCKPHIHMPDVTDGH